MQDTFSQILRHIIRLFNNNQDFAPNLHGFKKMYRKDAKPFAVSSKNLNLQAR